MVILTLRLESLPFQRADTRLSRFPEFCLIPLLVPVGGSVMSLSLRPSYGLFINFEGVGVCSSDGGVHWFHSFHRFYGFHRFHRFLMFYRLHRLYRLHMLYRLHRLYRLHMFRRVYRFHMFCRFCRFY